MTSPLATLASLAEPPIHYMDGAAMDYFLIEMVNTLRSSSAVSTARSKKIEKQMIDAGILPPPPPSKDLPSKENGTPRDSLTSLNPKTGSGIKSQALQVTDEDEEALRTRLEAIGMHVGANFAERLCRDKLIFTETLDAIKFICKDVWAACWDKQVDNLRTNHRGVYVLQDNTFKPVLRLSSWESREIAIKRAKIYAAMPIGIIRGALGRLGYTCTVSAEITSLPQCTFQVKLPKGS
ncbi:hypothetical protein M378DRAFT_200713 [Amanita muscaria Koide BX008]|uniref:Trafficking protein particle complex subunit 6B n=1 Tax=Amanita muscaria (strain Koide BX008) TaxID=946122 RepID=A0A0C2WNA4_AMAMK|nr:hypothetical protein M378DRAFT_200713 [Amanita muscaria Koide BX008]